MTDQPARLVPGGEPFFFPGGSTGCLLLHGFTAMPEEMLWLGEDLAERGYSVLGIRLAGHGTHPHDLVRTRWTDWLISLEEGLSLLTTVAEKVVVVGLSMGGILALLAGAKYDIAGIVAMSTPYASFSNEDLRQLRRDWWRQPVHKKEVEVAKGPLVERREAHYPAYPQFPTSILFEVMALQAAMHVALPKVQLPVLLMQSRQDEAVSAASMNQIYQDLGSTDKHRLWLDDFDHALVRDSKRAEIFPVIAEFVERVT